LHIALPLWLLAAMLWNEWSEQCAVEGYRWKWRVSLAAGVVLLAWTGWQAIFLCLVHPTDPAELAVYNHTHPEAKAVALDIRQALETGRVRDTEVTIQGAACWPYTWYLREYDMVDFVDDDWAPTSEDRLVVTDPGVGDLFPMLTSDFTSRTFPLRYAWIAPSIPFNELLCLRGKWGEPGAFREKMRFRARRSARMLWPLVRYVLLRKPYTQLDYYSREGTGWKISDLDAMAINPLHSVYWQRVRISPEPLLPPPERVPIVPPESMPTTAPIEIEDFLPLMEPPATGTLPARTVP
jgi:hypothetical protein